MLGSHRISLCTDKASWRREGEDFERRRDTVLRVSCLYFFQPAPSFVRADERILINYSMGDAVCGNGSIAQTVIQLTCGTTVGHPTLIR